MKRLQKKDEYILDKALDHAWQWFQLHATQRLQAVNFFLVGMAFLSAAYVPALSCPVVAAGVSLLGVFFSVVFYLFEVRIRELIKASEKALAPIQKRLAVLTGIPEFNICEAVEIPRTPYTSYSRVIRALYLCTALGCAFGFVYAIKHVK